MYYYRSYFVVGLKINLINTLNFQTSDMQYMQLMVLWSDWQQVTRLYNTIQSVIQHFETIVKNKETLNKCLSILELSPLKFLSWCGTWMAHFLDACEFFSKMLPAIHNAMFTHNIKKEECNKLFTVEKFYTLFLLSSIRKVFHFSYFRVMDKANLLVSVVYRTARNAAENLNEISTNQAGAFEEQFWFDKQGNMLFSVKLVSNNHTLMQCHSKLQHSQDQHTLLLRIRNELYQLKKDILKNIKNIRDKCDKETPFFHWSVLDLKYKTLLESKLHKLR